MTNAGPSLAGTHALSAIHEPIDTLLIAGGDEPALRRAIFEGGVAAWLASVTASTRRIASVCTGVCIHSIARIDRGGHESLGR